MLEDVKNVEQSVTFYNVTGYIEKENRIYFAPLNKQLVANAQAGTTKPLCQWYKDYFDSVVGILSSRYQNVSISRWSPSDRTLSVQGTIDLFRKSGVSSDSKAFNYMIVKREVTGVTSQDASINYTYYMGYFITDVQQSGTNTVRLTLDIDNFTNAFYLMNTKSYSDSELLNLDIFNSTLVNCNVERQHYNRVKLVNGEVKIDNNEIFLNPLESYDYKYQKKVSKSPILVNGVTQEVTVTKSQDFPEGSDHWTNFIAGREYVVSSVSGSNGTVNFTYSGNDYVEFRQRRADELDYVENEIGTSGIQIINSLSVDALGEITITYTELGVSHTERFNPDSSRYVYTLTFGSSAKPTISSQLPQPLEVFKENVFNQMTDWITQETLPEVHNFTNEELEIVKETDDWERLPDLLRHKIILASIGYVIIKAKESLSLCPATGIMQNNYYSVDAVFKPNRVRGITSNNMPDSLFTYMIPIIVENDLFSKYNEYIRNTKLRAYIREWCVTGSQSPFNSFYTSYNTHTNYVSMYDLSEVGEDISTNVTVDSSGGAIPVYDNASLKKLIIGLLGSSFSDYILSASLLRDYNCPYLQVTDISTEPKVTVWCNILSLPYQDLDAGVTFDAPKACVELLSTLVLPKGLWYSIVPIDKSYLDYVGDDAHRNAYGCYSAYNGGFTTINPLTPEIDTTKEEILSPLSGNGGFMFQVSGYEPKNMTIRLPEVSFSNIVTSYVEPILENNPYTFYSLSYTAGLESPFNKQKYYNSYDYSTNFYTIKLKFIYSNNDAQKVGFIYYYDLDDVSLPYYTDSLIFTLASQLPMSSDSYTTYYYQNKAQMKNQFAVNDYQRGTDLAQQFFWSSPIGKVAPSAIKAGGAGAIMSTVAEVGKMGDMAIDWAQSNNVITMNQKALLAGAGAKPDVVKQAGSDVMFDLDTKEMGVYLNYYRIDDFSYNSIAKGLERFGYLVNRYDTLHVADRVGWNYVKLISADFNHYGEHLNLTTEQESDIMDIFREGVTLLHSPEYLYNQSLHNHETLIDIDD